MKIRELLAEDADQGEDVVKLYAILSQIAARIKDTGSNSPMSLTAILEILNQAGLNLTDDQFREMYVKPPLDGIISGVEGDNVTFTGQRKETSPSIKPDQSTATLEKMAKRAEKKRR